MERQVNNPMARFIKVKIELSNNNGYFTNLIICSKKCPLIFENGQDPSNMDKTDCRKKYFKFKKIYNI